MCFEYLFGRVPLLGFVSRMWLVGGELKVWEMVIEVTSLTDQAECSKEYAAGSTLIVLHNVLEQNQTTNRSKCPPILKPIWPVWPCTNWASRWLKETRVPFECVSSSLGVSLIILMKLSPIPCTWASRWLKPTTVQFECVSNSLGVPLITLMKSSPIP